MCHETGVKRLKEMCPVYEKKSLKTSKSISTTPGLRYVNECPSNIFKNMYAIYTYVRAVYTRKNNFFNIILNDPVVSLTKARQCPDISYFGYFG